jgi:hypothetical protein
LIKAIIKILYVLSKAMISKFFHLLDPKKSVIFTCYVQFFIANLFKDFRQLMVKFTDRFWRTAILQQKNELYRKFIVCARKCGLHKQRNWTANWFLFFGFVQTTLIDNSPKMLGPSPFASRHLSLPGCVFYFTKATIPGTHGIMIWKNLF